MGAQNKPDDPEKPRTDFVGGVSIPKWQGINLEDPAHLIAHEELQALENSRWRGAALIPRGGQELFVASAPAGINYFLWGAYGAVMQHGGVGGVGFLDAPAAETPVTPPAIGPNSGVYGFGGSIHKYDGSAASTVFEGGPAGSGTTLDSRYDSVTGRIHTVDITGGVWVFDSINCVKIETSSNVYTAIVKIGSTFYLARNNGSIYTWNGLVAAATLLATGKGTSIATDGTNLFVGAIGSTIEKYNGSSWTTITCTYPAHMTDFTCSVLVWFQSALYIYGIALGDGLSPLFLEEAPVMFKWTAGPTAVMDFNYAATAGVRQTSDSSCIVAAVANGVLYFLTQTVAQNPDTLQIGKVVGGVYTPAWGVPGEVTNLRSLVYFNGVSYTNENELLYSRGPAFAGVPVEVSDELSFWNAVVVP